MKATDEPNHPRSFPPHTHTPGITMHWKIRNFLSNLNFAPYASASFHYLPICDHRTCCLRRREEGWYPGGRQVSGITVCPHYPEGGLVLSLLHIIKILFQLEIIRVPGTFSIVLIVIESDFLTSTR